MFLIFLCCYNPLLRLISKFYFYTLLPFLNVSFIKKFHKILQNLQNQATQCIFVRRIFLDLSFGYPRVNVTNKSQSIVPPMIFVNDIYNHFSINLHLAENHLFYNLSTNRPKPQTSLALPTVPKPQPNFDTQH